MRQGFTQGPSPRSGGPFERDAYADSGVCEILQAVSTEKAEIVRRWSERWTQHDVPGLMAALVDDVEVDFSNAEGPFRGVYSGRDAVIGLCRAQWEPWDEVTMDVERMVDCGEHRLATATVLHAKGRTSGVDVEAHVANLWTFRNGKVSHCKLFQTMDQAVDAAGASEHGAHGDA